MTMKKRIVIPERRAWMFWWAAGASTAFAVQNGLFWIAVLCVTVFVLHAAGIFRELDEAANQRRLREQKQ